MSHSKSYGFKIHNLGNRKSPADIISTNMEAIAFIDTAVADAPDTPLSVLAGKVKEYGYLPNMARIASGRDIGRVTPALASAILCESAGTHRRWHVCDCDRDEMQRHAARLLKAAFGIEFQAVAK